MSPKALEALLDEYSKKPYVQGALIISKTGVPLVCRETGDNGLQSFAPLVSITYEGAHELANTAGHGFKQMNLELNNGSRIVIKQLRESFLLAVQVQRYDDLVKGEIEQLGKKVSECI